MGEAWNILKHYLMIRGYHLTAFGFDDVCLICCCHSNHIGDPSSSFRSFSINIDLKISLCSKVTRTPSSLIIL